MPAREGGLGAFAASALGVAAGAVALFGTGTLLGGEVRCFLRLGTTPWERSARRRFLRRALRDGCPTAAAVADAASVALAPAAVAAAAALVALATAAVPLAHFLASAALFLASAVAAVAARGADCRVSVSGAFSVEACDVPSGRAGAGCGPAGVCESVRTGLTADWCFHIQHPCSTSGRRGGRARTGNGVEVLVELQQRQRIAILHSS